MGRTGPKTGLTDLIRKLAARPGGFRTNDPAFNGTPATVVGNRISPLLTRGEVFKAKLGHKSVVYFDSKAKAEACEAKLLAKRDALKGVHGTVRHIGANAHSIPGWKDAQPVITKDTKFTRGLDYVPRFQAVELPGLHGALQRGRVTG